MAQTLPEEGDIGAHGDSWQFRPRMTNPELGGVGAVGANIVLNRQGVESSATCWRQEILCGTTLTVRFPPAGRTRDGELCRVREEKPTFRRMHILAYKCPLQA